MNTYQPIDATYLQTADSIDFNLRNVPPDIMISLAGALGRAYQEHLNRSTDPHFRSERAKFIDNVNAAAAERGIEISTKQLMLGFK